MWNELILGDGGKPEYAPVTGISRVRVWGPGLGMRGQTLSFMSRSGPSCSLQGCWVGPVSCPTGTDYQSDACTQQNFLKLQEGRVPPPAGFSFQLFPQPTRVEWGLLHQPGCRVSWGLPHRCLNLW